MPSKEVKRLADTDLADLADYVPKRMRMTPTAAMCAGTGDNAVGQMAEIRTSARWVAASSAVRVASMRPTPSAPSWASRRFRTSGTAATARQRALMNRNHSSRPRRRRQARALHQRGVELPAAGPSAMQVPEGLLRQAWACLNRILIIKTELRSIIPGVPILGAL